MEIRIWVIIMVFCLSCSPFNRANRSWESIQKLVKENPALADSFRIVERDTIVSTVFRDSLRYFAVVDSAAVDSLALLLCASLGRDSKPPGLGKIRTKIITMGCPDIDKDTTYAIHIRANGKDVILPVHFTLKSSGGVFSIHANSGPVEIPQEFIKTHVVFNNEKEPFYKVFWFWMCCALFLFLIAILRRN